MCVQQVDHRKLIKRDIKAQYIKPEKKPLYRCNINYLKSASQQSCYNFFPDQIPNYVGKQKLALVQVR